MRSTTKKFRRLQSSSLVSPSATVPSNMTGDASFRFSTEQLEQNVKVQVESHVLFNLLSNAKQLNDLFYTNACCSEKYFEQIVKQTSHMQSNSLLNEFIDLVRSFFEKYLSSSAILRCYIYLHVPSSESGNNEGVSVQIQILKEIQEMEVILESNETLITDYYKKHYDLLKHLNKYPSIEDYHLYLVEYERKMFDDLRSIILELRTIFLKTYDLMMKNLTKIRMPRSELSISMTA